MLVSGRVNEGLSKRDLKRMVHHRATAITGILTALDFYAFNLSLVTLRPSIHRIAHTQLRRFPISPPLRICTACIKTSRALQKQHFGRLLFHWETNDVRGRAVNFLGVYEVYIVLIK